MKLRISELKWKLNLAENILYPCQLTWAYRQYYIALKDLSKCLEWKSLGEKCSNTEFFLVHIFLYSVQIEENTYQKKLRI